MKVLVTGIAGGLAREVGAALARAGHSVVGVDYREARPLEGVTTLRAHYHKTAIEDVFRKGDADRP